MSTKKNLINRELSLLQFQRRVLEEAVNPDNPLLERGNFISICSGNLDEFFMVRVGSLYRSLESGSKKEDPTGLTAGEQLSLIFPAVRELVERQYSLLNEEYIPLLEDAGIYFLKPEQLTGEQKDWLGGYFDREVLPLLTPRAVDDQRPFPLLRAKCIHLALMLPPAERNGSLRMALVPLPTTLPRVTMLPMGPGKARCILLEDVVMLFASRLFGGSAPVAAFPFRITRNTDFVYNDSDADALIVEMQKNLKRRKWGKVVRLEIPRLSDNRLLSRLKRYLDVETDGIFAVDGPLGLEYFRKQIWSLPGFDELRFAPFTPRIEPQIAESADMFEAIRKGDILLHHPYDSFDPVVRFVCEAADDPSVMAIKQTLYRVSGKSPIVAALSRAAQQGKQVTVLIEVRARFDEENNINWCFALEKAGCHVFYGVPNYKTHSKITLVVRKEENGLRRYVHLATGNYNDVTAKAYTDFGLLTCDEAIGRDAGIFFNAITGYDEDTPMDKLITAPNCMRDELKALIKRETKNALDGRPAAITAKMNSLVDPKVIKWLLKAAKAGVDVNLIVRGICCVKPKGYEDHLHIRSIVGRFLEHCRAFVFANSGETEVYLSSADWMPRNLDKRVELMFPVEDPALKQRVIATLQDELKDNRKAWVMKKGGTYVRVHRDGPELNCQEARILGPAVITDDSDEFYRVMQAFAPAVIAEDAILPPAEAQEDDEWEEEDEWEEKNEWKKKDEWEVKDEEKFPDMAAAVFEKLDPAPIGENAAAFDDDDAFLAALLSRAEVPKEDTKPDEEIAQWEEEELPPEAEAVHAPERPAEEFTGKLVEQPAEKRAEESAGPSDIPALEAPAHPQRIPISQSGRVISDEQPAKPKHDAFGARQESRSIFSQRALRFPKPDLTGSVKAADDKSGDKE